jgi:two-component system, response regulator YesN
MATESHSLGCHDRRISRVLEHVVRDLSRRPTLTEAAEVAGLEATYFSRLFRAVIGITFVEWSAQVRMQEAKHLLRIFDLSITAVAATVGYGDVTTFARVFKRFSDVCPREYRQRLWVEAREPRILDEQLEDEDVISVT